MRTISRDIVAAMIISRDGKMFLGMKDPAKGGVYCDCWHIPGGGIDSGETNEQALIREMKEELGIDISNYDIELIDDVGTGKSEKTLEASGEKVLCEMKFYVYRVEIFDKLAKEIEIILKDDLKECIWSEVGNLQGIKLTPPAKELFQRLGYL